MGFLDRYRPKKLFKAVVPDLREYVGRTVVIPEMVTIDGKPTCLGEKKVTIEHICGNKFKRAFYEINGEHLIGMLRFHAQMLGVKDITEKQFQEFEAMEMEAEKLPEKGTNGKKS